MSHEGSEPEVPGGRFNVARCARVSLYELEDVNG